MRHNLELLFAMTEREIKARYKNAFFGFLWIVLNPVLQMVVMGTIFSFLIKVPVKDYFLFLFSGLLVWNFFSLTLLKVTPSIIYELALIEKTKFPRSIIVISIVLSNLFHTVISFLLFGILLIPFGRFHLLQFLLLPIPLIWITILVTGVGLFTAALNVKYRDINFFVQAIVPLLFYGTPVIYSLNLVPSKLLWFFYINPLTSIFALFQNLLLNTPLASPLLLTCNLITTGLIFFVGCWLFRKESPFFDDWI